MAALYLIMRLGGERVAIAAEAVGAVIECGAVTPVPRAPAHILGVAALRGRVVTLIDAAAALGLARMPALGEAVLMTVGGHAYALVVDAVDDVIEAAVLQPPPSRLAGGWALAATGMIELDGVPLLAIDPLRLVDPPMLAAA